MTTTRLGLEVAVAFRLPDRSIIDAFVPDELLEDAKKAEKPEPAPEKEKERGREPERRREPEESSTSRGFPFFLLGSQLSILS
jgi:hypothetical protein